MVSQEPAKLSCVLSAVWVRVPVPPPHYMEGSHSLVQCTGLENRRPARVRGFESHPLRHSGSTTAFHCCYWYRDNVDRPIKINTLHYMLLWRNWQRNRFVIYRLRVRVPWGARQHVEAFPWRCCYPLILHNKLIFMRKQSRSLRPQLAKLCDLFRRGFESHLSLQQ